MHSASVFSVVSAAVTALVSTTGCAYLLFGPCGMYGCPRPYVTSLPPRDTPLARALEKPIERDRLEQTLNAVVNSHAGMPADTACAEAAVAGCRYGIPLQIQRMGPVVTTEKPDCFLLEVAVEARTRGGPGIGALKFRPMTCPQKERPA